MPLQTQTIPVLTFKGLNQKSDDKLVDLGQLLRCENAVYNKAGRVDKRNGYTFLGTDIIGAGAITNSVALGTLGQELIQFADNRLYSFVPALDAWQDKGFAPNAIGSSVALVRNTSEQSNPDSATANGLEIFAWEDTRGGIWATVVDETTKTALFAETQVSLTGTAPQTVAIGTAFYLFYIETGNLYGRKVTTDALGNAVLLVGGILNSNYSVTASSIALYVAYSTTTAVTIRKLTPALVIGPSAGIGEAGQWGVSVHLGTDDDVILTWGNTTTGIRARRYNSGLSSPSAIVTLSSDGATQVRNITAVTADVENIFVSRVATDDYIDLFLMSGSTPTTSGTIARSVVAATTPLYISGAVYLGTTHDSELQSTSLLLNSSGSVVAKLNVGNSGGRRSVMYPGHLGASLTWADTAKASLQSDGGFLFSLEGIHQNAVSLQPLTPFINEELGGTLFIGGGMIRAYDGKAVTEAGFTFFPEVLEATEIPAAGNLAAGIYSYVAVYEWMDGLGQVHRSAPSIPTQIAVTLDSSAVSCSVDTLRLTDKPDVTVNLYRTPVNGTGQVYFKVTSVSSPIANDPLVDRVGFVDTATDTDISANELLYTVGGVLENIAPPGSSIVHVHGNRVWIADENTLWFSNEWSPGQSITFNDSFIVPVETLGGDITALGTLDDKLVIFKAGRSYLMIGPGPDATGGNGSFSVPQNIALDVGCINAVSIANYPNGITFKSAKGIYQLSSQLQAEYIGAAVENHNDAVIQQATLVPNRNEIRFVTDGEALIYNYFFNLWSTWTQHAALDSVNWRRNNGVVDYVYLHRDGTVRLETTDYFRDGPYERIPLLLQTSWLSFAGLQNFQRVRNILLLGEYKSYHSLIVSLEYDFKDGEKERIVFNPQAGLVEDTYGADVLYGDAPLYGGADGLYQFRVLPKRQKCEAIRLTISDEIFTSSPGDGEGYAFNGITAEVGLKKGPYKLPSRQSI